MIWFFSKARSPSPRGVPLGMLEEILGRSTRPRPSRKGDALIIKNERLTTTVEVVAPQNPEGNDATISAIVTVRTAFPKEMLAFGTTPGFMSIMNSLATLGAATEENGHIYIGSRLTVCEGEDAWDVHFPLLMLAAIAAADSMLGATRRVLTREPPTTPEPSFWTDDDFESVCASLSEISVCTTGGPGLTAEFGLRPGELSVIAGHRNTALWEMKTDQPHPDIGGGLFCILNLPHQFDGLDELDRAVLDLNRMEMAGNDLPPHFGAWCRGKMENNPAYVSFLPNDLHTIAEGIALHMSMWAMRRAHLADAMLQTMGVGGRSA